MSDTASPTEASSETPTRSRRPKSVLDAELKIIQQIETRWRKLGSLHSKLMVLETLAADLDKKETTDGR